VKGSTIKIFDLDLKSDQYYQKNTIKTFRIPYIMTIGCKYYFSIIDRIIYRCIEIKMRTFYLSFSL